MKLTRFDFEGWDGGTLGLWASAPTTLKKKKIYIYI